jgi:hAT family C-terminal dimerisation region
MDRITSNLNHQTGKVYHLSLIAAMKLARKKMDRYYSLTDSSHVYRITMILHPGMKLNYFRNQKWEEDWIEEEKTLVREVYAAKYEKVTKVSTSQDSTMKGDDGFASFSNLSVTTCPHASEIEEYLSHVVENIKDPLKWWVDNKYVYLNLHRMALDYLSIPATSTSVERVFSQGRHLLPFAHNSLSLSSI